MSVTAVNVNNHRVELSTMKLALIASLLFALQVYGQNSIGNCAEDSSVAYPLRGWVGYTNTGTSIDGMTIEAFAQLGKPPVGTTLTDSAGGFSFPKLRPGKYFLKGTKQLNDKYVVRADDTITVTKKSKGIACLVAEAEAPSD